MIMNDSDAFDMDSITSQWYWRNVRKENRQVKMPRKAVVIELAVRDTVTRQDFVIETRNVVAVMRDVA